MKALMQVIDEYNAILAQKRAREEKIAELEALVVQGSSSCFLAPFY
jgi:hypothetical protein